MYLLDKAQEFVRKKEVKTVSGLLGLYIASKVVLTGISGLWYLIRPHKDLLARYGSNTWAVITGASDGIGKAFAEELAEQGFNIVLIARSEEKLQTVKSEFVKRFPNVQVRVVVGDFGKSFDYGFYDKIWTQIKDLDVSILINNVGLIDPFFWEKPLKLTTNVLAVNVMSCVMMTRLLIEHFKSRNKRSLIVNVNSGNALAPYSSAVLLSGSKRFGDTFSLALAEEYGEKIDVVSHICGPVQSTQVADKKRITPRQAAHNLLSQIGYETRVGGYWAHQLELFLLLTPAKHPIHFYLNRKMEKVLRMHN